MITIINILFIAKKGLNGNRVYNYIKKMITE